MNCVQLIGRLTRDIELTYPREKAVARFTLAVNRRRKDDGADFVSCVAFGKTAEILDRCVSKGQRVAVVGHIHTSSYEKDGRKVYKTDVIVESFDFIEKREAAPADQMGYDGVPM